MVSNMPDRFIPRALLGVLVMGLTGVFPATGQADESLFGYVKGAEPLPKGALELDETLTLRADKGTGEYQALDSKTELEYGFTDRLAASVYLNAMSIDTSGLVIDGYLPKDEQFGLRPSGIEGTMKYNFLSPAKDAIGLSQYFALSYSWIDPHSGQEKHKITMELKLLAQKFFLQDQLVTVANVGMEATHAERGAIDNLPPGFDWPTEPEMEIGLNFGLGVSYRFAPNWFAGVEMLYEDEHETEVGLERWTLFAGPSVHYAARKWWATLTWFPQIKGGGEEYPNQPYDDLHLIEKTKQEVRLRFAYNF
jgi:hypothetical protein